MIDGNLTKPILDAYDVGWEPTGLRLTVHGSGLKETPQGERVRVPLSYICADIRERVEAVRGIFDVSQRDAIEMLCEQALRDALDGLPEIEEIRFYTVTRVDEKHEYYDDDGDLVQYEEHGFRVRGHTTWDRSRTFFIWERVAGSQENLDRLLAEHDNDMGMVVAHLLLEHRGAY
jgi:hypothetical protein